MRKKFPINQLFLDFSYRQDKLILVPGQNKNIIESKDVFHRLTTGKMALHDQEINSAESVIDRLNTNLAYPEIIKVAHLSNRSAYFKGFAAIFDGCGWIFLNSKADIAAKNYYSLLLTAALGIKSQYPDSDKLAVRAEDLTFVKLLPKADVRSFFSERITSISPEFAADISNYFNGPFDIVLKRALLLQAISQDQYDIFLRVSDDISLVKPKTELYVSNEEYSDHGQLNLFD